MSRAHDYRAAAFAATCFAPRVANVARGVEQFPLELIPGPVLDFSLEPEVPGTSQAAKQVVNSMLALEAVGWVRCGMSAGYFAASAWRTISDTLARRLVPTFKSLRSIDRSFGNRLGTRGEPGWEPDVVAFSDALVLAQERLDDDHLRSIELVLLAPETDWSSAMANVRVFESALETGLRARLPDELLDEIRWSLGSSSWTESSMHDEGGFRLPSDWPRTWLDQGEEAGALAFRTPGRMEALAEARSNIENSLERFLFPKDTDATTTEARGFTTVFSPPRVPQSLMTYIRPAIPPAPDSRD